MKNEKILCDIKKDENRSYIVRRGQWMDKKTYVDIRERTKDEGYTKAGISIPIGQFKEVAAGVEKALAVRTKGSKAVVTARVQREDYGQIYIVVRGGAFMGSRFVDIREYLMSESCEGYTRRGLVIPEAICETIVSALKATERGDTEDQEGEEPWRT